MPKLDLRLDANYPDHPKILRLVSLLGAEGMQSHITLLCYVRRVFPCGILKGMDDRDIESAARWKGTPGQFSNTLLSLKLLELDAESNATSNAGSNSHAYKIHDWTEHNLFAATAPIRSEIAQNAAKIRWERRRVNAKRNAGSNAPSPNPSPSPSPSPIQKKSISLCDLFVQKILAWKPDFKIPSTPILANWQKEFRLMLQKDERSEERIKEVIDFATTDDFWQSNVLCAKKLRKQFDALEGKMRKQKEWV